MDRIPPARIRRIPDDSGEPITVFDADGVRPSTFVPDGQRHDLRSVYTANQMGFSISYKRGDGRTFSRAGLDRLYAQIAEYIETRVFAEWEATGKPVTELDVLVTLNPR